MRQILLVLGCLCFAQGLADLIGPVVSFAQAPPVPNGGILPGPTDANSGVTHVRDVMLPQLTNWLAAFLLASSVAVVIVGGLMFIFAGGDKEMTDKARNTILWSVLGIITTILAYTAVQIVINLNYLS